MSRVDGDVLGEEKGVERCHGELLPLVFSYERHAVGDRGGGGAAAASSSPSVYCDHESSFQQSLLPA